MTETVTTEPTPKAIPSILMPCPRCGEESASISLHLATLDYTSGENFKCGECDAEFSIDSVRLLLDRWPKLLGWIEAVPSMGD